MGNVKNKSLNVNGNMPPQFYTTWLLETIPVYKNLISKADKMIQYTHLKMPTKTAKFAKFFRL